MNIYNLPLCFTLKVLLEKFIVKDYKNLLKNTPYIFIVPNKIARDFCITILSDLQLENNIRVFSISDNYLLLKTFKQYANDKYLKEINSLINAQIVSDNKRNSLITNLIQHSKFNLPLDEAFILAKNLSNLLDIISTENININKIKQLNIHSSYSEILVALLGNIIEHWDKIIKEMNYYNILEFKAKIFNLLADIIKDRPNIKIVTFGIDNYSNSIINFLSNVANYKKGAVIMNGIDFDMNKNEWENLLPTHPQYINAQILKKLNIDRKNIPNIISPSLVNIDKYNYTSLIDHNLTKIYFTQLLNSIFNIIPTKFTLQNSSTNTVTNKSLLENKINPDTLCISTDYLHNISYIELNDESEEANLITQTVKSKLKENPNQEITIVTTSYDLSSRISFLLKQDNINYNNLLANKLKYTQEFNFFKLITTIDINNINFINLLSLLKHNLCIFSQNIKLIQLIDIHIAREFIPNKSLSACINLLNKNFKQKKISEEEYNNIQNILITIEDLYKDFNSLNKDDINFKDMLSLHLELAEKLSIKDYNNIPLIWKSTKGSKLKDILQQSKIETDALPPMNLQNYNMLLNLLLNEYYISTPLDKNIKVTICGILQARFTNNNVIFLSDLNEGSFPLFSNKEFAFVSYILKQLDLPTYDEDIGKQAFIFMQLCHCKSVYLTRSKIKQGMLTNPSRFIIKLQNTLQANNLKFNNEEFYNILSNINNVLQNHINECVNSTSIKGKNLPSANPEVKYRPKQVKITSIEILLKNPYTFFIESILNLNILPPINPDFNARLRGILVHDILDNFFNYIKQKHNSYTAKDLENILAKIAKEKFALYVVNYPKSKLAYYIFKYNTSGLAKGLYKLIQEYNVFYSEVDKTLKIDFNEGTIIILGRADYIASSEEKRLIIDFKTGSTPYSKIDIETFRKQLIILGYIDLTTNKENNHKQYNLSYYFIPNNFHDKVKMLYFTEILKLTDLNKYIYNDFENIKSILKNFLLTNQELIFNLKNKDLPLEYKHFSRIDSFKNFN